MVTGEDSIALTLNTFFSNIVNWLNITKFNNFIRLFERVHRLPKSHIKKAPLKTDMLGNILKGNKNVFSEFRRGF